MMIVMMMMMMIVMIMIMVISDYTSDTFVDATMYVVDERQCLLQQALIQSEATIDDFTVPFRDSVAI